MCFPVKIQIVHFSSWFNLRIGSSHLGIFCRQFLWSFYASQIMVLNFRFISLVIGSVEEQFTLRPVYQVSYGAVNDISSLYSILFILALFVSITSFYIIV